MLHGSDESLHEGGIQYADVC